MTVSVFVLFGGFLMLIKGADALVDGASSLARRLRISDIAVGLTIVAFGTSAPELVVNIIASVQGNVELAIGNVLGSNIFNLYFILGLSAVVFPIRVKENTTFKEIPLSFLAAGLLLVLANDAWFSGSGVSMLSRVDGIIFLAFFVLFLFYTSTIAKDLGEELSEQHKNVFGVGKSLFFVVGGLVGLVVGGKLIVDSSVAIARGLGVSEALIGLTIVSIGTSLPEVATSVVAAYKKNTDIAIGNIVGSNIFNIFLILGVSSAIRPLSFDAKFNFDAIVNILGSLILFVMILWRKRFVCGRAEGIILLCFYVAYMAAVVIRG